MEKTTYKYELALSYAHKDEPVAATISEEFKNIFQDRFFKDTIHSHELSSAADFKKRLRYLFSVSHYAVILYSPNYQKGEFAQVELKAITELYGRDANPRFFIINIDDTPIKEESLKGLTYILLPLEGKTVSEKKKLIKEIVHNQIKKYIMKQTLSDFGDSYGISVRTLFAEGNTPIWEPQYNWNLFTTEFINSESRKLKSEYTWNELWKYVKADFTEIYSHLKIMPAYQCTINLNCHLSIAYKLGLLYGNLSLPEHRNLTLKSGKGHPFTFAAKRACPSEENAFSCSESGGNDSFADSIICMVSLTSRDAYGLPETVRKSVELNQIKYKNIFMFFAAIKIENTDMLEQIVDSLEEQLAAARAYSCADNIHLFLRAPAALAFVLGNKKIFPGNIILYEYDQSSDSYAKSLERND